MAINIVVAVADNGAIGAGGDLPWHLPADLKRFKATTMGSPIIMGRKTFESIGKALPGRQNIVISGNPNFAAVGVQVVNGLDQAILLARGSSERIMIIGGATIYRLALPLSDRIYMTRIHTSPEGDTFFPDLDAGEWDVGAEQNFDAEGAHPAYSFVTYNRRRAEGQPGEG